MKSLEVPWKVMKFHEIPRNFMEFRAIPCPQPLWNLKYQAKPMVLGGAGEQVAPGPKGMEFRVFFVEFHGIS